jgi:hypothetical protein
MLTWVVAIVIVIAIVAVVAIARWQRKSLHKNLRLELNNRGNVQSRYELKAEDPDDALEFQFSLAGGGLTVGTIAQETAIEVSEVVEPAQPERPSATPGVSSAKQAQAKARQGVGFSYAIADLLGSLGMMLPRSIGAPLQQASSQLRRGSGRVDQVQRMPSRVSGQVTKVKQPAGSILASSSTRAERPKASAPPISAPASAPAGRSKVSVVTQSAMHPWVQTPAVAPGGSLRLDLQVKPVKARGAQLHSFSVLSRSVEQEDAAVITEEWSGQIRGVSGFRRYHPYLLIAALAVLALMLAIWLASIGVLS